MATTTNKTTSTTKAPKPVKINDEMIANVTSTVFGKLIFVDSRTGERVVWDKQGEDQQIPIGMLRSMKASHVGFFKNNWIVIKEILEHPEIGAADVYKALFVQQYYKNIIDPDDFESVCGWKESEIEEKVKMLSDGAKQNLTVAINTYIEEGKIDSLKKIREFERVLGCELSLPE